jgi:ribonuclease HI
LETCTEEINIAAPGATAQHAEILVVLAALRALHDPVNIVSESQYVVKATNSIETARLKRDPNSTIFQLFTQAQMAIQACTSPFFIAQIHSHTDLPGPMAKGNQAVDQLISFTAAENSQNPSSIFQQDLQSHTLLHQSANMLHKQFPTLTRDQCKHVIRACPTCSTLLPLGTNTVINPHGLKANHTWQTDVTHILQFGTLKYVHVTVDTYSGVLFASSHTGETTKHALGHLFGAFATFGIPKSIKTDNAPAYTSKKFQEFCKLQDVTHNTGIPYNSQGQVIIE